MKAEDMIDYVMDPIVAVLQKHKVETPAFIDIHNRCHEAVLEIIDATRNEDKWLPYPENKPSEEGWWQVTIVVDFISEPHVTKSRWSRGKWDVTDNMRVTAYRPMPEAYQPEERE